jgi:hypothetical protein
MRAADQIGEPLQAGVVHLGEGARHRIDVAELDRVLGTGAAGYQQWNDQACRGGCPSEEGMRFGRYASTSVSVSVPLW